MHIIILLDHIRGIVKHLISFLHAFWGNAENEIIKQTKPNKCT